MLRAPPHCLLDQGGEASNASTSQPGGLATRHPPPPPPPTTPPPVRGGGGPLINGSWNDDGGGSTSSYECFAAISREEQEAHKVYEASVGGYAVISVGLLGLLGNTLVLLTIFSRRGRWRNNCFNKLLAVLVSCDSVHILFTLLESVRHNFLHLYPDVLFRIIPYFHYPLYRMSLVSSIYLMVALAVERYLAFCYPMRYRSVSKGARRLLSYVVPALGAAAAVSVPRFMETKIVDVVQWNEDCSRSPRPLLVPTGLRLDKTYIVFYINWFWTVATGLLPFAVLFFLNARVYRALMDSKSALRKLSMGDSNGAASNGRGHSSRIRSNSDRMESLSLVELREDEIAPTSCSSRRHPSMHQVMSTSRTSAASSSREASMAAILVCSVTAFLLCHLPRTVTAVYESVSHNRLMWCRERGLRGVPDWLMYLPSVTRLLLVANASTTFPIYFAISNLFGNRRRTGHPAGASAGGGGGMAAGGSNNVTRSTRLRASSR